MEIVLAFNQLGIGGADQYLITVGEQLERLGHGVTVFAPEQGALDAEAAELGLRVERDSDRLPDECDVVLTQDTGTAYELADRYPLTPQVFRAPTELVDFQLPPQLPSLTAATVVISERVERQVRALATNVRTVRLRLPVDTDRFVALESIGERPRRALLLGNWLRGRRLELLTEAWSNAGIELKHVGLDSSWTPDPTHAIGAADIVVAKGRAAVESMACGRAVYLYDFFGGDGWVTPERYAEMEADNFAGGASGEPVSVERLRRDLDAYSPAMGVANRDLALTHHSARQHAQQLVALFRELGVRETPVAGPLEEMARLVRVQWQLESSLLGTTREAQIQQARASSLERDNAVRQERIESLEREARELREHIRVVEHELATIRASHQQLLSTRRYRMGSALGRIVDATRALAGRMRI